MSDGRFPTNTILVHAEGCEVDGTEEVPDWDCDDECSVENLDEQSGWTSSPDTYVRSSGSENKTVWGDGVGEAEGAVSKNFGDEGGASRFFIQAKRYHWLDKLSDMIEEGGMYSIHLTDLESSDVLGVELRRKGYEIVDTIVVRFPEKEMYGFLARNKEYDTAVEEVIWKGADKLLDIDACRIDVGSERKADAGGGKLWSHYRDQNEDEEEPDRHQDKKGRWPTNTVFVHAEGCEIKGTRKIEGHTGYPNGPGGHHSKTYQDNSSASAEWNNFSTEEHNQSWEGYADEDGKEEVLNWDCDDECSVENLDEQSGELDPQGSQKRKDTSNYSWFGGGSAKSTYFGDEGGASRFFYGAKTREEVVEYLEDMASHVEVNVNGGSSEDREHPPFFYTSKAPTSERDKGCEDLYWKFEDNIWKEIDKSEHEKSDGKVKTGNPHVTVKPLDLMEWLVENLTEKGDTVLDPFAGSGTTGIATLKTERHGHLVELDHNDNYRQVIKGRITGAKREVLKDTPIWEERPEIELPWDEDQKKTEGILSILEESRE